MVAQVNVTPEAFSYLAHQRGRLADLSGDFQKWTAAYEASLQEDYAEMRPHLPRTCKVILDIGSGLGGINALLNGHYGGHCRVCLVDGENDPPGMLRHARTHNSMRVARAFLKDNGVERFNSCTPGKIVTRSADLILSLQSWCFHYPVAVYLDYARQCSHAGTVLITDIRRDKAAWMRELVQYFDPGGVVRSSAKFHRVAFRLKPV